MLDKVLLGFVLDEPRTAYELARELEKWGALGLSSSQGSIHPALQSLLKAGLVDQKVEREGARQRKAYRATAAGRRTFLEWLGSPIPLPKGRDEGALRLLFADCLSEAERTHLFHDYAERLSQVVAELGQVRKARKAAQSDVPRAERAQAHKELMLLEWQRAHAKFLSKWHGKKRVKLEAGRS